MTEDEAKTKWCPFSRVAASLRLREAIVALAPVNRGGDGAGDEVRCLGSGCMAWRPTDNEGGPFSPNEAQEPASKPAGYCGLAGRP